MTAPVRFVLDSSALVTYAAGSIDVGEPLSEVFDEGCRVAIPRVCLVEAATVLDDDKWATVGVLLAEDAVEVLDWPAEPRKVAASVRRFGSLERAVAMMWATEFRAYVMTAERDAYGPVDGDPFVEVQPDP